MAIHGNPAAAVDSAAVSHGLLGLLTKVGRSKSENPHKHFEDYIQSVRKGNKAIAMSAKSLFNSHDIKPDKGSRDALKNHLQSLQERPEQLLDVGGNLADVLPDHAGVLAAKAGQAVSHLNAIKPKRFQGQPLDEVMPVDKMEEAHYDRHIDIAQNPLHIIQHVKDGTLVPSDLETLNAIYPNLAPVIKSSVNEALIDARSKDMRIPYRQKLSLGLLLGMPVDSTMTPQAMQAIMQSQAVQQQEQQHQNPPKRGKATNVEMKQINKVDSMYETPSERRQLAKSK